MTRLPRRLLLWGGAAAIASGGFAFMASNSLAASSAGDGTGSVTGYTVSTISYTPELNSGVTLLGVVHFKITSNCNSATTSCTAAYQEPKLVSMFTEKLTGSSKTVYGPMLYFQKPGTFARPDGNFGPAGVTFLFGYSAGRAQEVMSCSLTGGPWNTSNGSGSFTCSYTTAEFTSTGSWYGPAGHGEAGPMFKTFNHLDVEANQ